MGPTALDRSILANVNRGARGSTTLWLQVSQRLEHDAEIIIAYTRHLFRSQVSGAPATHSDTKSFTWYAPTQPCLCARLTSRITLLESCGPGGLGARLYSQPLVLCTHDDPLATAVGPHGRPIVGTRLMQNTYTKNRTPVRVDNSKTLYSPTRLGFEGPPV